MTAALAARLEAAGLSAPAAARTAGRFRVVEAELRERFGDPGEELLRVCVPGRIEVVGKHTDYAGGRSITCAVERGFVVAAAPRADTLVRVVDAADGRRADFAMDAELPPETGHWSTYATASARRLTRNFPGLERGADVVLASDLPRAAGLSSSSALLTAAFLTLARVNGLDAHPLAAEHLGSTEALAGYLGSIESGAAFGPLEGDHGVGTFGGSEDHTAIVAGRAGRLGDYRFCPVSLVASLPMPRDHVFVVATSGVSAKKTGGAKEDYNRASRQVSAIVQLWQEATGRAEATLAAIVEEAGGEGVRALLRRNASPAFGGDTLVRRLDHFLLENGEIVPAVSEAFANGALDRLGALLDRSQAGAEELLGNQVPETSSLARLARGLGAVAASAFGAGFGGSVWALVRAADAPAFADEWTARYRAAHPAPAEKSVVLVTPAGPAAFVL